jgi:hypothetical protein
MNADTPKIPWSTNAMPNACSFLAQVSRPSELLRPNRFNGTLSKFPPSSNTLDAKA